VTPGPTFTVKPSTATHVPWDAASFLPNTLTVTVWCRRASPSNMTARVEAVAS
jgi:hypothetical protein